jgi:hypothetical protein
VKQSKEVNESKQSWGWGWKCLSVDNECVREYI